MPRRRRRTFRRSRKPNVFWAYPWFIHSPPQGALLSTMFRSGTGSGDADSPQFQDFGVGDGGAIKFHSIFLGTKGDSFDPDEPPGTDIVRAVVPPYTIVRGLVRFSVSQQAAEKSHTEATFNHIVGVCPIGQQKNLRWYSGSTGVNRKMWESLPYLCAHDDNVVVSPMVVPETLFEIKSKARVEPGRSLYIGTECIRMDGGEDATYTINCYGKFLISQE